MYYTNQTLETMARNIINKYDASLCSLEPTPIPIEDIIEKVFKINLIYLRIKNDARILGETIFDEMIVPYYDDENGYNLIKVPANTIIIEETLLHPRSVGRLRFTLAHELAHHILHKEIFSVNNDIAALDKKGLQLKNTDKIEIQANMLATSLLMPIAQVKKAFYMCDKKNNPVKQMAQIFQVSKQAMEIRLKSHNLI